ncbi:hypothetical protein SAMN04489752_3370 [Brevibacterium siliguriense]|uniref:SipW-cognate class signal peptide n=1 Tax=Brevibacterium siliguriense TaxID=1136497 RepID=A0A1H1XMV9_9MICO|nr:hypothetical protein [Brevibacterium siliguriense]SDT10554.1 hypothetical protein SAMN04489752_3370 [Brevibacterium siliguriense]
MTGGASPRRSWRRARLLSAVVALLALVAGPAAINGTLAGWDDEKQSVGSFAAGKVPAPTLTKRCEYIPGILGLGARVRVHWKLPQGYQLSDVVVEASTSGLGSILAPITGFSVQGNTVANADGTYTTDVPTNLLGGLLGLGSELELAFFVEHDSGWRSNKASVASNAGLVGGIGGNCRNLTS